MKTLVGISLETHERWSRSLGNNWVGSLVDLDISVRLARVEVESPRIASQEVLCSSLDAFVLNEHVFTHHLRCGGALDVSECYCYIILSFLFLSIELILLLLEVETLLNHGFLVGHTTLDHHWLLHKVTCDQTEQMLRNLKLLDYRAGLLLTQLAYPD